MQGVTPAGLNPSRAMDLSGIVAAAKAPPPPPGASFVIDVDAFEVSAQPWVCDDPFVELIDRCADSCFRAEGFVQGRGLRQNGLL